MLLAAFFTYVYAIKRQSYLLVWAGGWLFLGLASSGQELETWLAGALWLPTLEEWLIAAAALLFLAAARLYSRKTLDRKSTRLNSSHPSISYAVFCLKKKKK